MHEIIKKLEGMYQRRYTLQTEERLGSVSISDIPGCLRRARYKLEHTPPSDVTPSYNALRDGHMVHEYLQDDLKALFGKDFHSVESEVSVPITDAFTLRGHIDGLLFHEGRDKGVEIKTLGQWAWKYRVKKVQEEYMPQACLYFGALGLKDILFFLRNKENGETDLVEEKVDYQLYEQGLERALAVHTKDLQSLPRIPADAKGNLHWRCNYCPYRSKCWDHVVLENVPGKKKNWRIV